MEFRLQQATISGVGKVCICKGNSKHSSELCNKVITSAYHYNSIIVYCSKEFPSHTHIVNIKDATATNFVDRDIIHGIVNCKTLGCNNPTKLYNICYFKTYGGRKQ